MLLSHPGRQAAAAAGAVVTWERRLQLQLLRLGPASHAGVQPDVFVYLPRGVLASA